jgi:hypothetical protein
VRRAQLIRAAKECAAYLAIIIIAILIATIGV